MLTLQKTRLRNGIAAVLLAGLLLTTCDMDMGLGPTVDLEPPILRVTHILLPDGTNYDLAEDDSKLIIGPGILFGAGAILLGEAWDNKEVVDIKVEEIGRLSNPGKPQTWTGAKVAKKTNENDGWQPWSIELPGITKGERVIQIVALDKGKNVGRQSMKQLTLLVDTNPPIIESIKIERKPGLQVDLLSKAMLDTLDEYDYANIDYFQNEDFYIRASIKHDFSISDVRLNFVDENGSNLFSQGLERLSGSVYTPTWYITAAAIEAANRRYATGKHYLNVAVTARAEAGHSGQNDIGNLSFNVCWYPEADLPRINVAMDEDSPGTYVIGKGDVLPLEVFDDDAVANEVFAAVIPLNLWDDYKGARTDDEALEALYIATNRYNFVANDIDLASVPTGDLGGATAKKYPMRATLLTSDKNQGRYNIIPLDVGDTRGENRLVAVAKDERPGREGKWGHRILSVFIDDDGVPMLSVLRPTANTAPPLEDGKYFTMEGSVRNVDLVEVVKVAWVPSDADPAQAESALKNSTVGVGGVETINGIKVWNLELTREPDDFLGGKVLRKQSFIKRFDIHEDFHENESKTFVLYTYGKGQNSDVFTSVRTLKYTSRPAIIVRSPEEFGDIAPGVPVSFVIDVESASGIPIRYTTMERTGAPTGVAIDLDRPLTRSGNTWTRTESNLPEGNYSYRITTEDDFDNVEIKEVFFSITPLPQLTTITSTHAAGSFFSADPNGNKVIIVAEFAKPVKVNTQNGAPRLRLANLTTTPAGATRYANYTGGSGSNRLTFTYTVQPNDISSGTGLVSQRNPLIVNAFDMSTMSSYQDLSADFSNLVSGTLPVNRVIPLPAATGTNFTNELPSKNLRVDGIAPVINGISVRRGISPAYTQFDTNYNSWLRGGHEMEITLTISKPLLVLGTPSLSLPFNGARASFSSVTNGTNNATLVFNYRVKSGDTTDNGTNPGAALAPASRVSVNAANCFTAGDLVQITDTVGADGNKLVLSAAAVATAFYQNIYFGIDAIAPGKLQVLDTSASNPPMLPQQKRFQVNSGGIEANAKVEYTIDGIDWLPTTTPYSFNVPGNGPAQVPNMYAVSARQTDRAGNEGPPADFESFTLGISVNLSSVTCKNPDNTYGLGSSLIFTLNFSGPVYNAATGTNITIYGRGATTGTAATINFPAAGTANNGVFTLTSTAWSPPAGLVWDPIEVTAIALGGVRRATDSTLLNVSADIITEVRGVYNHATTGRKVTVMTRQPYVRTVNGISVRNAADTANDFQNMATAAAKAGSDTVTLTFDHDVFKENGKVIIRPANGWYIPPVLTNDEYIEVSRTLNTADRNTLLANYKKTTHGLLADGKPDISTKYVLNFDQGVTGATGTTNNLRSVFNRAKFNWIEMESIDPRVEVSGTTVTLKDVALPPGRQWRIDIEAGAFRDGAGNTNAAWQTQAGTTADLTNQGTIITSGYFWSQTVAVPVIRVNRTSTNSTTAAPKTQTTFRIDSETPGAVITYGLRNNTDKFLAVPTAAQTNGQQNIYRAFPERTPGRHNSQIEDINGAGLAAIPIGTAYAANAQPAVGDTNFYTARKDYMAATATKANITSNTATGYGVALTDSGKGYEGAFKTVLVFRNPRTRYSSSNPGINNPLHVKIEAVNTQSGAVTISGFPMDYNQMDGSKSLYMYQSGDIDSDRIWISWEIVSEFWQVYMQMQNNTGGGMTGNSWDAWPELWYRHMYRTYGNYGLLMGHMSKYQTDWEPNGAINTAYPTGPTPW